MKRKNIMFLLFAFMCVLVSSFGVNGTLIDNQVAYYKMDGDVLDATGNGNILTNNGATVTTGIINQGYYFDGVNDYVTLSKTWTGEQTYNIWFKINGSGEQVIYELSDNVNSGN